MIAEHRDRIDTLGAAIAGRRLEAPVIFFLEMHRPLASVVSSLLTAGAPLLSPFIGREWLDSVQSLLESPEELERFMSRLEKGGYSGAAHGRH